MGVKAALFTHPHIHTLPYPLTQQSPLPPRRTPPLLPPPPQMVVKAVAAGDVHVRAEAARIGQYGEGEEVAPSAQVGHRAV